jgi:hypothetical protein
MISDRLMTRPPMHSPKSLGGNRAHHGSPPITGGEHLFGSCSIPWHALPTFSVIVTSGIQAGPLNPGTQSCASEAPTAGVPAAVRERAWITLDVDVAGFHRLMGARSRLRPGCRNPAAFRGPRYGNGRDGSSAAACRAPGCSREGTRSSA